jgi:hypothetical protein
MYLCVAINRATITSNDTNKVGKGTAKRGHLRQSIFRADDFCASHPADLRKPRLSHGVRFLILYTDPVEVTFTRHNLNMQITAKLPSGKGRLFCSSHTDNRNSLKRGYIRYHWYP